MTAGSVLRHPIKLLARRLRNGKRTDGVASSLDGHMRAEGVEAEGEAPGQESETIWYVGEVYQEIWDSEADAVYDDRPARSGRP